MSKELALSPACWAVFLQCKDIKAKNLGFLSFFCVSEVLVLDVRFVLCRMRATSEYIDFIY